MLKMVIIIGAGPAGIATSACLNYLSIPNLVLEREDCWASIWKKKTYDRLHLHVAKQFCQLPHMPFPKDYPKYVPRKLFVQYLDSYVEHFNVNILCNRSVKSTGFDQETKMWRVKAKNLVTGEDEEYSSKFLVVATGASSEPYIPRLKGLDKFPGDILHSTEYKYGEIYRNKNVLVVGSGNSGMEIALDLCNYDAKPSLVIRSPVHVLSKRVVHIGMLMLKYFPADFVDWCMVKMARLVYGDLTKYGITSPKEGPVYQRDNFGKFPVIEVGTIGKIKSGVVQTLPSISNITGDVVEFTNEKSQPYDAIVFATGFKRSTNTWLKDDDHLDEDGLPKKKFPNHWKGKNGFYCAGLARRGLYVIGSDALKIAQDIKNLL